MFVLVDYVVLFSLLLCSLLIGIFFGRKKQDSREYTSAKGRLGVWPVGLSQAVSFVSAITVQVGSHHARRLQYTFLCTVLYTVLERPG